MKREVPHTEPEGQLHAEPAAARGSHSYVQYPVVAVRESAMQNAPFGHCASAVHESPTFAVARPAGTQLCAHVLHTVPAVMQSLSCRHPGTHSPVVLVA